MKQKIGITNQPPLLNCNRLFQLGCWNIILLLQLQIVALLVDTHFMTLFSTLNHTELSIFTIVLSHRHLLESRITETREVISELRSRLQQSESESRTQVQQVCKKLSI